MAPQGASVDFPLRHGKVDRPKAPTAIAWYGSIVTERVWIIGAGFSRGVGGPLLDDLLSMRTYRRLKFEYPALHDSRHAYWVYYLFHHGSRYPEGDVPGYSGTPKGGSRWFKNAEDFLEQLDIASSDESSAERRHLQLLLNEIANRYLSKVRTLSKHGGAIRRDHVKDHIPTFEELGATALRLMAAECSWYVPIPERISEVERTIPYLSWAKSLDADDAILTFNYDCLVERLRSDFSVKLLDSTETDGPQLFKMHGSADWQASGRGTIQETIRREPAPEDEEYRPIMGMPGNSKLQLRRYDLSAIWELAKAELLAASDVYIIGYGMPESDASAREFLVAALAANQRPRLDVTIVLGDDEFRSKRLQATLRQAIGWRNEPTVVSSGHPSNTGCVVALPQYAQDFLQAYAIDRDRRACSGTEHLSSPPR